jgi:hypothetical protein
VRKRETPKGYPTPLNAKYMCGVDPSDEVGYTVVAHCKAVGPHGNPPLEIDHIEILHPDNRRKEVC